MVDCHVNKLAMADANFKATKAKAAWRHLAKGASIITSPLNKFLSQALAGISNYAPNVWKRTQTRKGVKEEDSVPMWMLSSADGLKPLVEQLNNERERTSPMVSRDAKQLFTNVDQVDLLEKMQELLQEVWKMKLEEVYADNSQTRSGNLPGNEALRLVVWAKKAKQKARLMTMDEIKAEGWRNSRNKKIITIEELYEWIKIAVDSSYVMVGKNHVSKQDIGTSIPQGMNASPFLSNLYLFMYELRFMKQFMNREADQRFFRDKFWFCARFQDDRWAAENEFEAKAMYVETRWGRERHATWNAPMTWDNRQHDRTPWHGMYPGKYLKLEIEGKTSFTETIHQDVKIKRRTKGTDENGQPVYYYTTEVYDRKYDDPGLESIRKDMIFYQRPSTMLSDQCIYGVVYSEMARFSRRCSRKQEFMMATKRMVNKMVDMEYEASKIEAKIKKFVRKVPHLFSCRAKIFIEKPLIAEIRRAVKRSREEKNKKAAERVMEDVTRGAAGTG